MKTSGETVLGYIYELILQVIEKSLTADRRLR